MPRVFVTKDNEGRFNEGADKSDVNPRTESYGTYNMRLIKHEFVGLKLYGLVAQTPEHFYISEDDKKNLALNVEFLEGSQSLREYLGIDPKVSISSYTDIQKQQFAEKLSHLQGIGPLLFMGLLLGDNDVFGAGLDNVRVIGDQAFKIDASDVKLPFHDNELTWDYFETFSTFVETPAAVAQIPPNQAYGGIPYAGFIFSLLSDAQKAQGLAAMKALTTDENAAKQIAWLASRMGYDEKALADAVDQRAHLILKNFHAENIAPSKINNITQTVIVRSAAHFQATGVRIVNSGNSEPEITQKTYSEKAARRQILEQSNSHLGNIIQALKTKQQSLINSNDTNKADKIRNIDNAIASFTALYKEMEDKLDNPKTKITRKDLLEMQHQFNTISNVLRNQLLTDKSEKGLLNTLRRNIAQTSTIDVLRSHTQIFNNPLVTFFSDTHARETSIKMKKNSPNTPEQTTHSFNNNQKK